MNIFFIILMVFFVSSCGQHRSNEVPLLEATGVPFFLQNEAGDTAEMSIVYDFYYDSSVDKLYKVELYNPYMRRIDVDKKQIIDRLDLSSMFSTPYNYQVYFHNWDTIITYEAYVNLIHFSDSIGNIYKTIDFNKVKGFEKYDLKADKLTRIEFKDGKLYLPRYLKNYRGGKVDLDINIYFSYDLKDGSIHSFMRYPEEFYKIGCYYSGFEKTPNIQEHPKGFVVSFVSPDMHLYDYDGKLLKKKKVKSEHLGKFKTHPYPDKFTAESEKKQEKFLAEAAFYYEMRYDPFRKLYYRVALPNNSYVNKDNSLTDFSDRDFYIMVIDTNLNVLDEVLFDGKKYFKHYQLVTKEGLLVIRKDFIQKRKEPDPIRPYDIKHYELFKVNYGAKN